MAHGPQFPQLDAVFEELGDHLSEVRATLYFCDLNYASHLKMKSLRQSVHASSYVHVAAAVERCVNAALTAVVDEINSASPKYCDLRPSLFSIIESGPFASLQDVRGLKMWRKRREIYSNIHDASPCKISATDLPLDGRTIKPEHFEVIWEIFGFAGSPMPSPLHRLALSDLSASRNKLAHGEERAATVAGSKSIEDTLRLYKRVEEVLVEFWQAAVDYLATGGYKR